MRPALPLLIVLAATLPGAASAHGWGGRGPGGWGSAWDGPPPLERTGREMGPPEGRISVARFVAEGGAAGQLGHGTISVTGARPDSTGADEPSSLGGTAVAGRERAVYEAAVVDELVRAGYRTDAGAPGSGQVAEITMTRETIAPAEQKKPVSGTMAVGVSNRGTAYGLGLNVDLTKPRAALVATRLEARIRDRASGKVLWEGRADVNTREGDDAWPESKIAVRLAAALFDGFPGATGESLAAAGR